MIPRKTYVAVYNSTDAQIYLIIQVLCTTTATFAWNLRNVKTYNVILANQKFESCVYYWLCAHIPIDVMWFSRICRSRVLPVLV